MKVTLSSGDETRTFTVTRKGDTVEVTDADGSTATFDVTARSGIWARLAEGTARHHLAGTADGNDRQLWLDGQYLAYRRVVAGTAGAAGDELSLASPIPAVVVDILVEPGAAVTEGQKLVLLESMKMVLPISATKAGTVHAILCEIGESVAPGVPLVEFEAHDE